VFEKMALNCIYYHPRIQALVNGLSAKKAVKAGALVGDDKLLPRHLGPRLGARLQ